MSNEDKLVYITRQRERYREFHTRSGKSLLITEVAAYLKITRDHAIRILNGQTHARRVRSGPRIRYTDDLLPHLKKLYFLMRQPYVKRMTQALPQWLDSYQAHFGMLDLKQVEKLKTISAATLGRKLSFIKKQSGISSTRAPRYSWYKSVVQRKLQVRGISFKVQ